MWQRTLAYLIVANFALSVLCNTTAAVFATSAPASMSLAAGRVEMRLSDIADDESPVGMSAIVVNDGTIRADLWLENVFDRQIDASGAGGVTIEVTYGGGVTTFNFSGPEMFGSPLLLLKSMEPGSEALLTFNQNASLQPNFGEESLPESPPGEGCAQPDLPIPYIFEFILRSGTFTSLPQSISPG